jgi:hypothetical protein
MLWKTAGLLGGLILHLFIHIKTISITYIRIFDLEMAMSDGNKDEEDDEDSNGAGSQEAPCNDPYRNCPCHKKNGAPPPPPPPTMGGYYGEGAAQFAMWEQYYK